MIFRLRKMTPMQRTRILGSTTSLGTGRVPAAARAQGGARIGGAQLLSTWCCLFRTRLAGEMPQRIRRSFSLLCLGSALIGLSVACGGGGDDTDESGENGSGGGGSGTDGSGGSSSGGGDATGGNNGSGGDAMSSCGSPGRSGTTSCAASVNGECPAGQYCDSEMLTCSLGCTSDENCPADEECVRDAGEAVGSCSACASCGDGTCSPGETAESCSADCDEGGPDDNTGLDECFEMCDSFDFFCEDVAGDACTSACVEANAQKRASFVDCADSLDCDTYTCVSTLD